MNKVNKKGLQVISKKEGNKAIVFAHGFNGNYNPYTKFLENLRTYHDFPDWSIYLFRYPSNILGRDPNVTQIAESLRQKVMNLSENEIALIGYSMGGLITKKMLVSLPEENLNRIKHCVLLATPNLGVPMASCFPLPGIFKKDQLRDLSCGSPFLKKLNGDWQEKFPLGLPFSMKIVAGTKDWLVPVNSALGSFPEDQREIISSGHLHMVNAKNSAIIKILSESVKQLSASSSSPAALSQAQSGPAEKPAAVSKVKEAGSRHESRNSLAVCFGR